VKRKKVRKKGRGLTAQKYPGNPTYTGINLK
jgi:hypothetical protein